MILCKYFFFLLTRFYYINNTSNGACIYGSVTFVLRMKNIYLLIQNLRSVTKFDVIRQFVIVHTFIINSCCTYSYFRVTTKPFLYIIIYVFYFGVSTSENRLHKKICFRIHYIAWNHSYAIRSIASRFDISL